MKEKVTTIIDFVFDRIPQDLKSRLAWDNMGVLRIVSLFVTVLESWLLIATLLMVKDPEVIRWNAISLAFCIVTSALTWYFSRRYIKRKMNNRIYAGALIVLYYLSLAAWAMNVSFRNYRFGFQMLTFFIVQFCFASFTIFPPIVSAILFSLTYGSFHYVLYFHDGSAQMNPMNYFALSALTIIASWIHYSIAVHSYEKTFELERLNEELESFSRQDDLTGLKNRHALREDEYLYENHDLIVMMADLDEFKKFNDQYGHAIGDRVLEVYSQFLCRSFGEDNVYRFGGDEFLIIKRIEEKAEFDEGISHWEDGVSALAIEGYEDLHINGSAGYTIGRGKNPGELKALIRKADEALYVAKNSGKNKVCSRQ